jgi:hypothetical protein
MIPIEFQGPLEPVSLATYIGMSIEICGSVALIIYHELFMERSQLELYNVVLTNRELPTDTIFKRCNCCGALHRHLPETAHYFADGLYGGMYFFNCECQSTLTVHERDITHKAA